jgi:hypothetical protein
VVSLKVKSILIIFRQLKGLSIILQFAYDHFGIKKLKYLLSLANLSGKSEISVNLIIYLTKVVTTLPVPFLEISQAAVKVIEILQKNP